jgi:hypothetical protein
MMTTSSIGTVLSYRARDFKQLQCPTAELNAGEEGSGCKIDPATRADHEASHL